MKAKDDIETEISDAIVAEALRDIFGSHFLAGTKILGGWLSLAAQLGQLNTLRVLIESGAPINWANDGGETAFSYACSRNQLDAATVLFQHGPNVNSIDSSGGTPLDCAVYHASPDFRDWLRSIGGRRIFDYHEWPWPPVEAPHGPPSNGTDSSEDAQ